MSFLLGLPVFKGYVKFRGVNAPCWGCFWLLFFLSSCIFSPKNYPTLGKKYVTDIHTHICIYTIYSTYLECMCINDQIFSNIMFIVSFLFGSIWILKFIPKNVVLVWLRKPIELIQLLHLIHELGRCAIFEKSSSFRILSFLKWSQKKTI